MPTKAGKLTRSDQALAALAGEPQTTGELAAALGMSGQQATELLRGLGKAGAVASVIIPQDRRLRLYHLPSIDDETALRQRGYRLDRPLTRAELRENYRRNLAARGLVAVEVEVPEIRVEELRAWAAAKRQEVGVADTGGRGGARSKQRQAPVPLPAKGDAASRITRTRVTVPQTEVEQLRQMAANWCAAAEATRIPQTEP